MNNTILIFDFDGTIADTHLYLVELSNRLSKEFNYNIVYPEELELLKDKTSQEIIRYLKVPLLKIPSIIAKGKKELNKGISSIQPIKGLKEILLRLKSKGIKMGILSSNSKDNILIFLKNHGLDIFDFICATSKVWSKDSSLRRLMDLNGFHKNQILYIGDEIRDIAAAKKLGIKIAAVGWGYNSPKALKKNQPDYYVQNPQELLDLCSKIFLK